MLRVWQLVKVWWSFLFLNVQFLQRNKECNHLKLTWICYRSLDLTFMVPWKLIGNLFLRLLHRKALSSKSLCKICRYKAYILRCKTFLFVVWFDTLQSIHISVNPHSYSLHDLTHCKAHFSRRNTHIATSSLHDLTLQVCILFSPNTWIIWLLHANNKFYCLIAKDMFYMQKDIFLIWLICSDGYCSSDITCKKRHSYSLHDLANWKPLKSFQTEVFSK